MSEYDVARQACLQENLLNTLDEELEMGVDNHLLGDGEGVSDEARKTQHIYFRGLLHLQGELVRLQDWAIETGHRLAVIFEGRDTVGKGGAIKRIAQRLNPRMCRVTALPTLTSRERMQ